MTPADVSRATSAAYARIAAARTQAAAAGDCCSNVDGTHWDGCDCTCHAELDATMREQIATAVPCDECGEIGHDAGDHDPEPNPELLAILTAALPDCR